MSETKLSEGQIDILRHTRNRTANGLFCGDSPDIQALVAMGLMESAGRAGWCPDEYFRMTGTGLAALSKAEGSAS